MVFIFLVSLGHGWHVLKKIGSRYTGLVGFAAPFLVEAASASEGLPALGRQLRHAAAPRYLRKSYAAAQAVQVANATRSLSLAV
jgi:hypothetical protein